MAKVLCATLVATLLSAGVLCAQTNTAWPVDKRPLATTLSDVDVAALISLDLGHAAYTGYKEHTLVRSIGCEAAKLAIANSIAIAFKHYVPEERPNGADNKSFPSQHTANAFASIGWKWQVAVPLAISTGYLRTAGNWHWWKDVGAGALIGLWSDWFVSQLDYCQK